MTMRAHSKVLLPATTVPGILNPQTKAESPQLLLSIVNTICHNHRSTSPTFRSRQCRNGNESPVRATNAVERKSNVMGNSPVPIAQFTVTLALLISLRIGDETPLRNMSKD